MNSKRLILISGFVLLVFAVGLSACQPVAIVSTEFDPGAEAKDQPPSGSQPSENSSGETSSDEVSLLEQAAYFPRNPAMQSTNATLDQADRSLVMEITQYTDDHWVEMAQVSQGEDTQPAVKPIRYRDDHWAEMAEIRGDADDTLLDTILQFTDDHWVEMKEIHQ